MDQFTPGVMSSPTNKIGIVYTKVLIKVAFYYSATVFGSSYSDGYLAYL